MFIQHVRSASGRTWGYLKAAAIKYLDVFCQQLPKCILLVAP